MTPQQIFVGAAALLNDQIQSVFTDAVLLPYYNMAQEKLGEVFELNNIPVTNDRSIALPVAAGVNKIAFYNTVPLLPSDLVDVRTLWESPSGQNNWTIVDRRDFIPLWWDNNTTINQFLIYSWQSQEIKLIAANANNDIKIDYVKSILPQITISEIIIPINVINANGFLRNWTAGLAAWFIGENESRATALYGLAEESLERSLGISIKGQQNTPARRRPFRQGYKSQTIV